ncbi:hypothetical protein WJX74_008071 [Apatococcus lobatus]|uniref:Cytosol aminopeptidase domain-containing protein n=1 Tax=Apatococcus lobatus TaxID=904363 RepID=A0AAW1SHE8_9CHLO
MVASARPSIAQVNNTDAEGRLTLADALLYAEQQDIKEVVDIATLMGACIVALGTHVAGPLWGLSPPAKLPLPLSSEKVWRMPMEESYWELMKSPIAAMKNIWACYRGANIAALFLKQYIDTKKVQWAHVDFASPAWDDKARGATGSGAQTLALWAMGRHGADQSSTSPAEAGKTLSARAPDDCPSWVSTGMHDQQRAALAGARQRFLSGAAFSALVSSSFLRSVCAESLAWERRFVLPQPFFGFLRSKVTSSRAMNWFRPAETFLASNWYNKGLNVWLQVLSVEAAFVALALIGLRREQGIAGPPFPTRL